MWHLATIPARFAVVSDLQRTNNPMQATMSLTLKRISLVAQVADCLRSEVLGGTWQEWIPSERNLSQILHVSRSTCSAALKVLRNEGLIEPVRGRGIRIKGRRLRNAPDDVRYLQTVGIIIPDAIWQLSPGIALFVDELREELFDYKVRVQLHSSRAYYKTNPQRAIERLVDQVRHDCWILTYSRESIQRWFAARKLPCVVLGSTYPGIPLSSVGVDVRAVCRHAAGKLIALGHRRIVFFNRRLRSGGDIESEQGFKEAIGRSRYPDVEARVVYHDDDRESVIALVQNLFTSVRPPTGLLAANSHCYLSIVGALAQRGLRIPEDISVISRDDNPVLNFAVPQPSCYVSDPHVWVRKMMYPVRQLLKGINVKPKPIRIVSRFSAGGSCGPMRGDGFTPKFQ